MGIVNKSQGKIPHNKPDVIKIAERGIEE